jgi:GGDEF domain-containing protein
MKWFDDAITDLVRQRGVVVAWELAAVAAILPYLIGPAFTQWPGVTAPPYGLALSLASTIALLAALRCALATGPTAQESAMRRADLNRPATQQDAHDRDASTGLPLRGALEMAVDQHDPASGPALLGVVRFANCVPMTAFDAMAARRVMKAFGRRLESAVASRRPLAQINDDTFAIWFAGADLDTSAEAEFRAIAYVLAQENADCDNTEAPDIHVACAWRNQTADTLSGLLCNAQAGLAPHKRYKLDTRPP